MCTSQSFESFWTINYPTTLGFSFFLFFLSLSLFLFSLSFCFQFVVNFPLWEKSFQNKIRIWYLCSFLLVHLSTFTPLNGLLQLHVLFESFLSLPFQWIPHRGLGTNAWFARNSGAQCNMVENSGPQKKEAFLASMAERIHVVERRRWKYPNKAFKLTLVTSWISSSDTSSGKNLARNLNWSGDSFLTSWLWT